MTDISTATQPTVQAIYDAWARRGNDSKGHRAHLGASILGNECSRALWYTFRWSTDVEFEGRLLRLFDRGHLEEDRFTKELRFAGITVYELDPSTGRQFQFSECGGHVGGSMDGVGKGFLEAPEKWHVTEFKTHSDKSFKELKKKGVEESKPQHYAQMQLYMGWAEPRIDRAFYLAVNKDNDELYSERIKFDETLFDSLMRKAWDIVKAPTPLEKMTDKPDFYKCNFCSHKPICHERALPAVNCRTCVHATPELNGKGHWRCEWHEIHLPTQHQRQGCQDHRFIPALLNWAECADASDTENWVEYEFNGKRFRNGKTGQDSYESIELRQVVPELLDDDFASRLREQFGAYYADNSPDKIKVENIE